MFIVGWKNFEENYALTPGCHPGAIQSEALRASIAKVKKFTLTLYENTYN